MLAVAFATLASSPVTQAQSASFTSTITENERSVVFGNSTSTVNAIQVVCLATATSTVNATRTVVTYTGLQTAFVVKSTVTVTQPIVVTATSTTTIATCHAYSEHFVATQFMSVPLVLYSEVQLTQSSTLHQGPTRTQALGQWPATTGLLVAVLILFSLFAAILLLLRGKEKNRQANRKRVLDGF